MTILIKSHQLHSHIKKNGKEVEVDKGQTIDTPDDLSMNIKVVFKSIPVATLIEHNGKFVYNLPKEFQIKETTTKNMTQDSDVIGTITVDTNGKVVVAYNDEYLKNWVRIQQLVEISSHLLNSN